MKSLTLIVSPSVADKECSLSDSEGVYLVMMSVKSFVERGCDKSGRYSNKYDDFCNKIVNRTIFKIQKPYMF